MNEAGAVVFVWSLVWCVRGTVRTQKLRNGYQKSHMKTEDRVDIGGEGPLSWQHYGLAGVMLMSVLEPEDFMPVVR
jgi:hypothetical protein